MNKMKTHSGAKKRIKITATGRLRRGQAFTNHLLEKKSAKRKRALGRPTDVAPADERAIKRLLGR